MRLITIIFLIIALSNIIFATEPEETQKAPQLNVQITSPAGGQTSNRLITIEGTISDTSIQRAYIIVNSAAYLFDVRNGSFQYPLILAPGENIIQILAQSQDGKVASDTLILYASVPTRDVQVVMTWDTPTDVDLHVIDPSGQETFYSSRESKIGGQLDRDDTDGFGPETFTLSNAIEGKYTVKSKFYGGTGQTVVKITTVLFAGTSRELAQEYFAFLTKSGQFQEICSFFVQQ